MQVHIPCISKRCIIEEKAVNLPHLDNTGNIYTIVLRRLSSTVAKAVEATMDGEREGGIFEGGKARKTKEEKERERERQCFKIQY